MVGLQRFSSARSETQTLSYLFEDCELDLGRRELRRGGANIAVEPQVFDLLVHLIQHRDRVISKEELLASIWHGRIVSESALFNRINATRTAIGDTGEMQRLIKTLPRKGIRFVGVVHEDGKGADAVQVSQRRPATVDTDGTWTEVALSLPDRPSLAVLPFTNMSGDPDRSILRTAFLRTSSQGSHRSDGCSSSPATLRSSTSTEPST